MGDERGRRIDDALSHLVDNLVPVSDDENEDVADARHDQAVDLARNIIEGHNATSTTSDVQHAADLIKKKLLRENDSPDKAVQFSNLYTRLLSQPVIKNKWETLYLLHQLAGSGADESFVESEQGSGAVEHRGLSIRPSDFDDQTYRDAFATTGLPKPSKQARQTSQPNHFDGRFSREASSAAVKDIPEANEDGEPTAIFSTNGPSEAALLRDLPFTLQGLSTTNMPLSAQHTLILPPTLPLPVIYLLHDLAEPSLLYHSLSEFVESKDESLIGQSLRSAFQSELRSYLGLITSLETQIRQALSSAQLKEGENGPRKIGVTLKRCVLWTREATMALRLMSLMVEESKTRKGGQLISMIHSFSTSHGDPFVGAFAERLLTHVTRPFYDMLRSWIYDGELSDPYHEFFVIEQGPSDPGDDSKRAPATSVWEEKYRQDDTTIPTIITDEFARKIFLIGKSLNFIRYSCGDSAWVEAYSKDASRELKYGDTATLESSIDQAYRTTMARLTHLMDTKFQLFEHLSALKRYLLLGQGDFIALLMESLSSNLDRPAGSQYRHMLTAQLEHAIRGSNAQYDPPDILRRLDARLTEMEKGDTGWDVFTLEYKVDAPVDVIITPWANRQYLKIFNLLWRVKRVEFALGSTWRRCMTGARGVLASVGEDMRKDWKKARCAIAEMVHFVDQLQYYILFEVIEASWDILHAAISKPGCTLDDLISAHSRYLRSITHKGLLGSVRVTSSGHKEDVFTVQLHEILKLILSYKEAVDGLYSFSVADFTRKQELAAKIETRTAQGRWGLTEKDEDELNSPHPHLHKTKTSGRTAATGSGTDSPFPITTNPLSALPPDEKSMLPALRTRLSSLSADFKVRINNLLGDLAVQPDVDMKFLAMVMNFNDVYQPRKRRRHGTTVTGAAEKKTPAPANASENVGNTTEKKKESEGLKPPVNARRGK
ncbi:uncharacterized protein KY384_006065 [Bacidia gigantensis]|uniref:uncharacterized protein n=1 Tax=Bacidia gigantensis TaxID=2732470 RepID=UPI001D0555F8|nr:uncharacterized protein KY384_006065 [Bacidia gigantensis]KAG8529428.1 hypothetical protein KY384_006065 [Bacidia gigantensis]